MKEMFPVMLDQPRDQHCIAGAAYWFFAFFLWPALLALSTIGEYYLPYAPWLETGYHGLNFLIALIIFFPYLKENFLLLQIHTKKILGTAAICAVIIVILKIAFLLISYKAENKLFAQISLGTLLSTEADLLFFPTILLYNNAIAGTISTVLFAPFTISCLLYATIFAPLCGKRPWLAYLVTSFLYLVIHLLLAFCLFPFQQEMVSFLIQLPIHLIACWSYQKTESIWTPILTHILVNLLITGGLLILR